MESVIRAIARCDIPVMGHVGLTPQSVHRMGGYRVQGRQEAQRQRLRDDARAVQEAVPARADRATTSPLCWTSIKKAREQTVQIAQSRSRFVSRPRSFMRPWTAEMRWARRS